jgi:hypothetical protein
MASASYGPHKPQMHNTTRDMVLICMRLLKIDRESSHHHQRLGPLSPSTIAIRPGGCLRHPPPWDRDEAATLGSSPLPLASDNSLLARRLTFAIRCGSGLRHGKGGGEHQAKREWSQFGSDSLGELCRGKPRRLPRTARTSHRRITEQQPKRAVRQQNRRRRSGRWWGATRAEVDVARPARKVQP